MKKQLWMLAMLFVLCSAPTVLVSCSNTDNPAAQTNVSALADLVWEYAKAHPDGFTLDLKTMTEPTEGIAVSYAATQNSHSRDKVDFVVKHALAHEGYVGGWLNSQDDLYYFDSTRLFPEDQLEEAIQFGKENKQSVIFIISTGTEIILEY